METTNQNAQNVNANAAQPTTSATPKPVTEKTPKTPKEKKTPKTATPTAEAIEKARQLLATAKAAGLIGQTRKGGKRIDAITDTVKALPKGGQTFDEVARIANQTFIAKGGEDNLKQTLHHLRVILPVIANFGIAEVGKGRLTPIAKK